MNNSETGAKFAVLFFSFAVMASGRADAQIYSWDYYYNKAFFEQTQGDYAGAMADLNLSLKIAPDNSSIYNARGLIYEKFGDYLSAMADYERALSLNPGSAEALHNIRNLSSKMKGGGSAAPPVPAQRTVQGQAYTQSAGGSYPQGGSYSQGGSYPQAGRLPVFPAQDGAPYFQGGRLQTAPASASAGAAYPQGGRLPADVSASGGYSQAVSPPAAPAFTVYPVNSASGQTPVYGNAGGRLPSGYFTESGNAGAVPAAGLRQAAAGGEGGGTPYTNEVSVRYQYPASASQPPLRVAGNMSARYNNAPAFATPVQKVYIDPVAETYNSYGMALSGYGLYNEAILQFTEAIKTYSNYAIAYNNRGLAFACKGDWESASADFDQALRINPYYYDAQFNRARVNGTPLKR